LVLAFAVDHVDFLVVRVDGAASGTFTPSKRTRETAPVVVFWRFPFAGFESSSSSTESMRPIGCPSIVEYTLRFFVVEFAGEDGSTFTVGF
jgi:hypothetical protein